MLDNVELCCKEIRGLAQLYQVDNKQTAQLKSVGSLLFEEKKIDARVQESQLVMLI